MKKIKLLFVLALASLNSKDGGKGTVKKFKQNKILENLRRSEKCVKELLRWECFWSLPFLLPDVSLRIIKITVQLQRIILRSLCTTRINTVVYELTDLGEEQEVLAIPSHIEGFPVTQIGWDKGWTQIRLRSDNLKKIYIPYTVDYITKGALSGISEFETILLSSYSIKEHNDMFGAAEQHHGRIYVTKEFFDFYFEDTEYWGDFLFVSNLIYYYNYDGSPNLDYYWIDNITGDNLFINPANPMREGYIFTGWYLDSECTIEWDGTKPESRTETIEIYAGWEKN